ncbi:MAG: DUF1573 domain-containing protein [Planctomycetaceae bacterium]|nr:DUF1573 domain-containing protein [Planctomycetaceae bacterium]
MSSLSRSRSGRIELIGGLLLLAGIVGAGIGLALARSTPVEPGVVVDAAGLDFGGVWEQPAYRHSITLSNPTGTPIHVAEIKTGCGCTQVAPQSLTLGPGETKSLVATLDLTGRGGGSFAVDLLPLLAHQPPGDRTVWTLRGKVRKNPIELSQPSIDFGDEVIQGESLPTREVNVSLDEGYRFDDLEAHVVEGKGQAKLAQIDDGRWRLQVTPAEGLPLGQFRFTVRVAPTRLGSHVSPSRNLAITGTVRDDIAGWPETVNFGVLEIGEEGRDYVVLASRSGRAFEVKRIESPSAVRVRAMDTSTSGGSITYVVTETARNSGIQNATLLFHVAAPSSGSGGAEETVVPITVTYFGVRPQR